MNKVYLAGKIVEISEFKFFYNSKKHDSQIVIKIETFESNLANSIIVQLKAYDYIADIIYKNYNNGDVIIMEGRIVYNMEIEIVRIYETSKEEC